MPRDVQLWTWAPVFTLGFYLTLCLWKSLPGQYPGNRIPVGNGSALLLHFASQSPLLPLPLNIGFLVFVCHPQYDGFLRKWTCSSLWGGWMGESQGPIIQSVIHCRGARSQKLFIWGRKHLFYFDDIWSWGYRKRVVRWTSPPGIKAEGKTSVKCSSLSARHISNTCHSIH